MNRVYMQCKDDFFFFLFLKIAKMIYLIENANFLYI